ncbi:heterokaryon incompatibility protein-domain-containing protein [Lasiosphaeria ovina]|uniref:Heterokaryon incompatibility protein-domain-containing protein n=1 Tax=Lasiosphaeria ovina TaxID=92902 RepID=A0AAE0N9Y9_9PEZI|nr:heterokaryon incompatibility protein-domain-containing protein [Lasiosphaeria ovina]
MRLLNVRSRQLHTRYDDNIPPYAILSHTWDQQEAEVSFEDMKRPDHVHMPRYDKIENTCRLAEIEGLEWVWIDTCCIDKSSSAELSEAINSMFRWYEKAAICFAHLADVQRSDTISDLDVAFENCRWFTRGWTLQELLAPGKLVFYDRAWGVIGDRASLAGQIQRRTAIPAEYLSEHRDDFREARVGERMSWASDRNTTRREDLAYCLFGIFDIHMPLLYGEGDHAFRRLQEEILKTSVDDSIFAWSLDDIVPSLTAGREVDFSHRPSSSPLASSPRLFYCLKHSVMSHIWEARKTWEVTGRGLRIELPIYRGASSPVPFILLNGVLGGDINSQILALSLRSSSSSEEYIRGNLWMVDWNYLMGARRDTIYIRGSGVGRGRDDLSALNWLQVGYLHLKVAAGLGDRIIATCSLAIGLG